MRQKSNSTPASPETLVRNKRRATRKHHAAEERSASCSTACAVRPRLPSFAGAKAFIHVGHRKIDSRSLEMKQVCETPEGSVCLRQTTNSVNDFAARHSPPLLINTSGGYAFALRSAGERPPLLCSSLHF